MRARTRALCTPAAHSPVATRKCTRGDCRAVFLSIIRQHGPAEPFKEREKKRGGELS